MDNKKDIQKTESAMKFLDYQTLKSNVFGDNRVGERVYRRTERIASAFVLLTNHLKDSEPLKNEARKSALEMISLVLLLRDELRSPNSAQIDNFKLCVRKNISIVRLLGVSGYVSFQNAEILTEAMDDLLVFLAASRRSGLSDTVTFTREDLLDIKDARKFSDEFASEHEIVRQSAAKELQAATAPAQPKVSTVQNLSSRGLAILEVLRTQGVLGIRDIAANLPEYSEKMIQRELVELAAFGRVKKSGMKRWSRYSYI